MKCYKYEYIPYFCDNEAIIVFADTKEEAVTIIKNTYKDDEYIQNEKYILDCLVEIKISKHAETFSSVEE